MLLVETAGEHLTIFMLNETHISKMSFKIHISRTLQLSYILLYSMQAIIATNYFQLTFLESFFEISFYY